MRITGWSFEGHSVRPSPASDMPAPVMRSGMMAPMATAMILIRMNWLLKQG